MIFEMNEKSYKKYDEWSQKHDKECPYLRVGSAGCYHREKTDPPTTGFLTHP